MKPGLAPACQRVTLSGTDTNDAGQEAERAARRQTPHKTLLCSTTPDDLAPACTSVPRQGVPSQSLSNADTPGGGSEVTEAGGDRLVGPTISGANNHRSLNFHLRGCWEEQ